MATGIDTGPRPGMRVGLPRSSPIWLPFWPTYSAVRATLRGSIFFGSKLIIRLLKSESRLLIGSSVTDGTQEVRDRQRGADSRRALKRTGRIGNISLNFSRV